MDKLFHQIGFAEIVITLAILPVLIAGIVIWRKYYAPARYMFILRDIFRLRDDLIYAASNGKIDPQGPLFAFYLGLLNCVIKHEDVFKMNLFLESWFENRIFNNKEKRRMRKDKMDYLASYLAKEIQKSDPEVRNIILQISQALLKLMFKNTPFHILIGNSILLVSKLTHRSYLDIMSHVPNNSEALLFRTASSRSSFYFLRRNISKIA